MVFIVFLHQVLQEGATSTWCDRGDPAPPGLELLDRQELPSVHVHCVSRMLMVNCTSQGMLLVHWMREGLLPNWGRGCQEGLWSNWLSGCCLGAMTTDIYSLCLMLSSFTSLHVHICQSWNCLLSATLLTLNIFTMWVLSSLLQLEEGAIDLFSKTVKDDGLAIDGRPGCCSEAQVYLSVYSGLA
jgi:hypothetical protein